MAYQATPSPAFWTDVQERLRTSTRSQKTSRNWEHFYPGSIPEANSISAPSDATSAGLEATSPPPRVQKHSRLLKEVFDARDARLRRLAKLVGMRVTGERMREFCVNKEVGTLIRVSPDLQRDINIAANDLARQQADTNSNNDQQPIPVPAKAKAAATIRIKLRVSEPAKKVAARKKPATKRAPAKPAKRPFGNPRRGLGIKVWPTAAARAAMMDAKPMVQVPGMREFGVGWDWGPARDRETAREAAAPLLSPKSLAPGVEAVVERELLSGSVSPGS